MALSREKATTFVTKPHAGQADIAMLNVLQLPTIGEGSAESGMNNLLTV
jgi:hypothetical protein